MVVGMGPDLISFDWTRLLYDAATIVSRIQHWWAVIGYDCVTIPQRLCTIDHDSRRIRLDSTNATHDVATMTQKRYTTDNSLSTIHHDLG